MNIKTLELNILLNKYDALKTELDFKMQKLDHISQMFYVEALKEIPQETENNNTLENDIKEGEDSSIDNIINNEEINNEKSEKSNNNNESINEPIEEEKKGKNSLPIDIKNIFRKIVVLTHPDKLKDDDPYKSIKLKYYLDVQKAVETNNILLILLVANKLNIEYELENDYNNKINESISILELQLKNIEYTSGWIWYHSANDQLKNIMLQKFRETIQKSKRTHSK